MLSIVMLSVTYESFMLSVIMLNVVAPVIKAIETVVFCIFILKTFVLLSCLYK